MVLIISVIFVKVTKDLNIIPGKYYYTGDTNDINYIRELSLDETVKKKKPHPHEIEETRFKKIYFFFASFIFLVIV